MKDSTLNKGKNIAMGILVGTTAVSYIAPQFLPSNSIWSLIFIMVSALLTMILVFGAVIFTFIYIFTRSGIRSSEMEKLGKSIGWNFQKKANLEFLKDDAERLQLGEYIGYHPFRGETHNLLSGKIHNIGGAIKYGELSAEDNKHFAEQTTSYDALIFDQIIHHDVWEHGIKLELFLENNRHGTKSKEQTMFLIKLPEVWFPPFCVEPEGFWNKLHDVLDNQDFDFPEFPVFSHKYKLFGGFLEKDIRQVFNEDVIRFFEKQNHPFITVGHEDRLLIYQAEHTISPENFDNTMKFLLQLAHCFMQPVKVN
jgi:hypothetical protein